MSAVTECRNKDSFSRFHPAVNFTYFALVLGFSMMLTHPVCQAVSLICSIAYAVDLCGIRGTFFCMKYALPMFLLTAIISPAFNHAGVTILTYLPSGNPLTLESILYGLSSGCMLGTLLIWFLCVNRVITSDKFVYLFGRIVPSLSLLFSMILRFIPRFTAQFKTVSNVRKSISGDTENESLLHKLKTAATIFSITMTWSLENAIETADSMKSRGYGLKSRTAFTAYQWEERDKIAMAWLIFCGFTVLCGQLAGLTEWRYLPTITNLNTDTDMTPLTVFVQAVYLFLCLTPVIINIREGIQWKKSESTI